MSVKLLVVGNIPYDATEEQLKEIFQEVGIVVSFRYAPNLFQLTFFDAGSSLVRCCAAGNAGQPSFIFTLGARSLTRYDMNLY